MGQYFGHLRKTAWFPTFEWVESIAEAADIINRPHEDYPARVQNTHLALESKVPDVNTKSLLKIHAGVFGDTSHGGRFREIDVRVGLHIAPTYVNLSLMMDELYRSHTSLWIPRTEESLIDWYSDFETIHPFQDGNGRVGGIVVAQYSHLWFPDKGWMAPNQ